MAGLFSRSVLLVPYSQWFIAQEQQGTTPPLARTKLRSIKLSVKLDLICIHSNPKKNKIKKRHPAFPEEILHRIQWMTWEVSSLVALLENSCMQDLSRFKVTVIFWSKPFKTSPRKSFMLRCGELPEPAGFPPVHPSISSSRPSSCCPEGHWGWTGSLETAENNKGMVN